MSDHRDRAELSIDEHLKKVLIFMQRNIPTHKLIAIAEALPKMAVLLWEHYPQQRIAIMQYEISRISGARQSVATESVPGLDVGNDSVTAECAAPQ
jgi:hypothetical protein